MAGGFPYTASLRGGTSIGVAAGSSSGTSITSGGTAHTKGSWTQIGTAPASGDACAVFVGMNNLNASTRTFGVDIGIGASGSQVVILNNIPAVSQASGGLFACTYMFVPVNIPAGSTIWARCQSSGASQTLNVSLILFDGDFDASAGFAGVDGIGFAPASSNGTGVSASAGANTKGSYSQIAIAARDYDAIAPWGFIGTGTWHALMDIAIGAAGAEQPIAQNILFQNNGSRATPGGLNFIPVRIKAGTRISARIQASTGASSFSLVLYGAYK